MAYFYFPGYKQQSRKDNAKSDGSEMLLWQNNGKWKERWSMVSQNCLVLFKDSTRDLPDFALDIRSCRLDVPEENNEQGFLSFMVRPKRQFSVVIMLIGCLNGEVFTLPFSVLLFTLLHPIDNISTFNALFWMCRYNCKIYHFSGRVNVCLETDTGTHNPFMSPRVLALRDTPFAHKFSVLRILIARFVSHLKTKPFPEICRNMLTACNC